MLNIDLVKNELGAELIMIGEIDANTAPDADAILKTACDRFNSLTLNMAQVEYISSAGLRTLKRANLNMRRKGGTLQLKGVSKSVMEVLELTGFAMMFKYV